MEGLIDHGWWMGDDGWIGGWMHWWMDGAPKTYGRTVMMLHSSMLYVFRISFPHCWSNPKQLQLPELFLSHQTCEFQRDIALCLAGTLNTVVGTVVWGERTAALQQARHISPTPFETLAESWVTGICSTGVLGSWHRDLGSGQCHWVSAVLLRRLARVTTGCNASLSAATSCLPENSPNVPESSTAQQPQPSCFSFFPPGTCAAALAQGCSSAVPVWTREHRAAGSSCPRSWLAQGNHQNLSHMTLTSNSRQISIWLLVRQRKSLRLGIYAAASSLLHSYPQDCQNYLIPARILLQFLDCHFRAAKSTFSPRNLQIRIGRDLNTLGLMGWDSFR